MGYCLSAEHVLSRCSGGLKNFFLFYGNAHLQNVHLTCPHVKHIDFLPCYSYDAQKFYYLLNKTLHSDNLGTYEGTTTGAFTQYSIALLLSGS